MCKLASVVAVVSARVSSAPAWNWPVSCRNSGRNGISAITNCLLADTTVKPTNSIIVPLKASVQREIVSLETSIITLYTVQTDTEILSLYSERSRT